MFLKTSTANVLENIVNKYIPKMENMTSNISLVSIIVAVLLLVVAFILKKKFEDNDGLFTTEDTFIGGTSISDDSSNMF